MQTQNAYLAGQTTPVTAAVTALQTLMRELGYQHPAYGHLAYAVAVLMSTEVCHEL